MDELKFFLGLGAITIVVIGLVFYFGLKLNKVVNKSSMASKMRLHITSTGTVPWACLVGFWVIRAVARELRPESLLGGFLNAPDGVTSAFALSIVFAAVAGAVLERLGYPNANRGEESCR